MMRNPTGLRSAQGATRLLGGVGLLLAVLSIPSDVGAVDPYAPSRDYSLENVKTHLWFDLDHRKVIGETTQTLTILRNGVTQLKFDSVDLKIEGVTLEGKKAKFETPAGQLIVSPAQPTRRGEKFKVMIRYNGQPKKGLYFVLPDKNYPDRRKEVWSQGEDEDTRYYIPIYDYPNNRTTSEMLLTVPADWLTVSNGRLVSVKKEADGMKTWDWKQSKLLSTYLISVVAGEFVETKDAWRGLPLEYIVPHGDESKISPTFERTKQMLSTFSDQLGVRYPWAKYAQTAVDDFVVRGMENTSATTLTARDLVNPKLSSEKHEGSDGLISHELAHQWFGDLVTCRDWANLWLNEGFATYFAHDWTEAHYGADDADYEFWRDGINWMRQKQLFAVPIVTWNFKNSVEYAGNIYAKGAWVLRMLREKLGDDDFWRAMHDYLETYRGQNVVTSDLVKAVEQTTAVDVDEFFNQWVYGAGAPEFKVKSIYDATSHVLKLEVKQTQKIEGRVGLFHVPVEVEITTASGRKSSPIDVSQANETFSFPVDGPPLMVLFDKGGKILKSVEFHKDPTEWIYQLKNAAKVADRADSARALGEIKGNDEAVAALGAAALHDPFWGVRREALEALGELGGSAAKKQVLAALANEQPWVRDAAVAQLGKFKEDASLTTKLEAIAREDEAYAVRAAALKSLAEIKAPNALAILTTALKEASPDDTLRAAALRALGILGDDKAVPLLLEWSAAGKPLNTRGLAILALAGLDKKNKDITKKIVSYLSEPYNAVRYPAIFALGRRGDPNAIGPLEALLKSGDVSIGATTFVENQIRALKAAAAGKPAGESALGSGEEEIAKNNGQQQMIQALERIERRVTELNERLRKIEELLANQRK